MERDPLLISTPPLGVPVTRNADALGVPATRNADALGVPATRNADALGRPEQSSSWSAAAADPPTQQLDRTPVGGVVIAPPARRAASARGRRRWLRRTLLTLLVLVVAALAWFGLNLYQVHSTGASDQARTADAIVVMGAAQYNGRPSPQLAARLDHVVQLWNDGDAPLVVVTGGKLAGDRFTEAEASARYLTERGVPAAAILEENQAHNSYDSLRGVRDLLSTRGLRRVLLVSDPYHSLRIRLVSQELGMTAYVSPTRTSPVRGGKAFGKELEEAAGTSVGRIIGFRRLLSITG